MKSNLLTKLTLVFALVGFSGQTHALVSFGLKGGLGVNKLSVKDTAGVETVGTGFGIGYQGGLSAEFGAGLIGVSADVLYAQRGQFLVLANSTWSELLIPVQAKFSLIPFLSLGVGGYYSMALTDITTTIGSTETTTSFDAAGLKKGDFGALASVGINIPLGVTTLSLEGRYYYGLANRLENATGEAGATNSAFDMLVGFTF